MAGCAIERLTGPDAYDRVEPVMHEYLLYISYGFTEVPAFTGSEVEAAGADRNARYLELRSN